jgi:hypothetical protein
MMADPAEDRRPGSVGSPPSGRRPTCQHGPAVPTLQELELPTSQTLARVSRRVAAIAESATLAVDAKAKALRPPASR